MEMSNNINSGHAGMIQSSLVIINVNSNDGATGMDIKLTNNFTNPIAMLVQRCDRLAAIATASSNSRQPIPERESPQQTAR